MIDNTEIGSRHVVFVYGTLKTGGSNHGWMRGQHLLGPARTRPGFTLYSLGDYPGLVAYPQDTEGVFGELWAVTADCLARLDAFEGVPENLYARVPAPLASYARELSAHNASRAEMYQYLQDTHGRPHLGSFWAT
jgi:gamma-glutamylcyclotransferase (GGCT)/AIG2-like uncharacterized protein YtfP